MDVLAGFFRKLWILLTRQRFNRELEEEMSFHREQQEKALVAEGMSAEEARYAAIRQFGNDLRLKEQSLDVSGFWLETAVQDIRYAGRQLTKNPGFAFIAIIILGLGIGACTAIFSAVNPILFEPLPYPNADRITMIWERLSDGGRLHPSFGTFRGVSERAHSFEKLAVMKPWQPAMIGARQPERFNGQRVSAGYFSTLGVAPALGRDFVESDDQYHGPRVVILSDSLWRRQFGGDSGIVGRELRLDDDPYTVIGVMPVALENVLSPTAQLWAPLQYDPALPSDGREWGHHLRMVGRLRPGVTREQARGELDPILQELGRLYAKGYESAGGVSGGFVIDSLQGDITRGVKPALLAILGAVFAVLLIACVNVTNLLLARGAQRRGEFAMRTALGAGRRRLVRQLLTETLLLAFLGGALGMLVAELGVRSLVALSPPGLPRLNAISVDRAAFLFALGVTALVGLAVGLIPGLDASRGGLHRAMQQSSQRTVGGHQRTRRILVVAEVAMALALLVSAGLLLRSMRHLFAVDPGFEPSNLLTMEVQESGHQFDDSGAKIRFFEQALEAVRRVPGVVSAGFTSQLPLSGAYDVYGVEFQKDRNSETIGALRYAVTPGYLETMRIPLRRGRLFNDNDKAGAPAAVLIDEAFAKREFQNQDPIGQRVRLGPDAGHAAKPWGTIVGIVGEVKQTSLQVTQEDSFYVPTKQWTWADNDLSLVVRTRGDAAVLAPAIKSAIWSVDKDQPIVHVATMDNLIAASAAERRFVLILFEAFGLIAMVLAATGIYGVLSGSVSERLREIGVRLALGAPRENILALVVRQGMTLTALGVAIGLAGGVAASQLLATLLFGISRLDPVTYLGVIGILATVSAIACWLPAWRAAQVDPLVTLRAE